MYPLFGRCPSPFLPRLLLLLVHLSRPRHAPLFRNFRAHRSQSRVGALWYVSLARRLIVAPIDLAFAFLLSGLYCTLFAGCVKVLYNKRRRSRGGNHRLILVSITLFVLITWVRLPPCVDHTFHSSPYSIWSSISFDCTSPSKGVRQLMRRIFTSTA
jgi:hypothetical protein